MTALTFTITFHGPFHIGGGAPESGLDSPVDLEVPLPGSSIKGLMRAQATYELGVPALIVDEIFGSVDAEATWRWTDGQFPVAPQPAKHARLKLADDDTGSAESGFLMLGEHLWATMATFLVSPRVVLPTAVLERDRLVLRAAARCVAGLGGARRRGEGWVSIADTAPDGTPMPWDSKDTRALLALRTEASS